MGFSLRMVIECSAICDTPDNPSNLANTSARNWLTHGSRVSVADESLVCSFLAPAERVVSYSWLHH